MGQLFKRYFFSLYMRNVSLCMLDVSDGTLGCESNPNKGVLLLRSNGIQPVYVITESNWII